MVGLNRSYRQYRGRGSGKKPLIALLLILVIALSLGIFAAERYMVMDGFGQLHLSAPTAPDSAPAPEGAVQETPPEVEISTAEEAGLPGEVEVEIEPAEEKIETHALLLAETPLTEAALAAAKEAMAARGANALVVTLKDDAGRVYYDSASAISRAKKTAKDTAAALAALTADEEVYSIARVSCLLDPLAANSDVSALALKNTGGYIFYDGNNSQWLDPSKDAARAYLTALLPEIAALGFDEIQLCTVSYPLVGKLNKIAYNTTEQGAALARFLSEAAAALEPYDVTLSVECSEQTIAEGADATGFLTLDAVKAAAGKVYAVPGSDPMVSAKALEAGLEYIPEVPEPLPEGSWLSMN